MLKDGSRAPLLLLGFGWGVGLITLAVALPAMTTDPPTQSRKSRTGPFAVVVGVLVIGIGLLLWAQHDQDKPSAYSDLGSAVVGAAVVAFAILFLERRFDTITARETNRQKKASRDEAERQHTQLLTALRDDLPGVDLSGRHLDGFYLRAKKMQWANLTDCKLAGANLSRAVLINSTMAGATLDDAYARAANFAGADLTGASLLRIRLRGADLSRGARLARADLLGADLQEADLRGTDLRGALNLGKCNLTGARYDGLTNWPPGLDFKGAGAIEYLQGDTWKSEAADKAGDPSVD